MASVDNAASKLKGGLVLRSWGHRMLEIKVYGIVGNKIDALT